MAWRSGNLTHSVVDFHTVMAHAFAYKPCARHMNSKGAETYPKRSNSRAAHDAVSTNRKIHGILSSLHILTSSEPILGFKGILIILADSSGRTRMRLGGGVRAI